MTDEKKYNTFRDLRAVTPPKPAPTSTTSSPSIPSTTRTASRPSTPKKAGIAPERDFTRVPNSVARQAVPERVFRGKSKQVYDYLWSVSRGAVVPSRTVRKSRKEIQKGAGLGSMVTADAALAHLQNVGLIRKRAAVGSLEGNEYEVFTYEEAPASSTSTSRTTSPIQNLVELVEPESSSTSTTQVFDSQRTSEDSKTSFKTKERNTDDEAAPLARALAQAERELTGKNSSKREQWAELASLLITELKIAAGRTVVSSVPAFLAEHLRRRLWKTDKARLDASGGAVEARERALGDSAEHKIDASGCPDCFGTNMRYHDGDYSKGVERCPHDKLPPPD